MSGSKQIAKRVKNNKILVVGSGISGCVIAERYASRLNKDVTVLEKRSYIGGQCHDFTNSISLLVPKYGPHFFHTNYEDVWDYVNQFGEWHKYEHRVLSKVDNKLVPVPVNITTVNLLLNQKITNEKEMKTWLERNVSRVNLPSNSEESALSSVGKELYEKLFKNYTKKHWGLWPKQLHPSVMDRIPIRMNFDDRYFTDKYQYVPTKGYTEILTRMLNHPKIQVRLKTDYFKVKDGLGDFENVFFTGRIDDLIRLKGIKKLPFRSLRFRHINMDVDYFQVRAQINYPNEQKYTRITEPKHATGQRSSKTTIIKEYPTEFGEPFYPIPNPSTELLYSEYKKGAEGLESAGIYCIGRLANYKYVNMDQAFKNALDLFEKLNY